MDDMEMVSSIGGGALIGAAAVLLMAANGRIAGISGIVAGVLSPLLGANTPRSDLDWRIAFIVGLAAAPWFAGLVAPVEITAPHPLWITALGGALVGVGVRMGSGCTSGHGVCGIARLSKRSVVATGVFMGVAMVVVFILHKGFGL